MLLNLPESYYEQRNVVYFLKAYINTLPGYLSETLYHYLYILMGRILKVRQISN